MYYSLFIGYIIVFLLATASLVSFGMIIVLPFKYNFRGPILDFLIDYWYDNSYHMQMFFIEWCT